MGTLSRSLLFILSLSAGAAIANIYYAQPLLAVIAESFRAPNYVGALAVAPQVGYMLGILFILPLGDLVDRRKLTLSLVAILVIATLASALAPNFLLLVTASLLIGFGATITQVMIPLAADLAEPDRRARAVGTVFSGVLAGLLLARSLSGLIGQTLGWRWMFIIASGIALMLGLILAKALPKIPPRTSQRYTALLVSMFQLVRQYPQLRMACVLQASAFGIFSAFWSVLALYLSQPPFEFGPAIVGSFGLIGLTGILAANFSGRLIEKIGSSASLLLGLSCGVVAFSIFLILHSITGLVIGIVLLDFGLSIANVSNQSKILGLDAQARSRINTIYVTSNFTGGAIGSTIASVAWVHQGWSAVCLFGLVIAMLALAGHLFGSRQ